MRRIALLAAAVIAAACSPNKGTQVKASGDTFADSADQVFYGVEAPFENNGVKRGTLFADTMYVMNDQSRFDFIQGRVEFNTTLGVPDGSMRADRGRYDRRSQTLEGWGNVVVKSADGKSLRSPHVVYSQLQDRISSDTTFEFIAEGKVSTGKGFETNTALTNRRCIANCSIGANIAIPK
ncbi:MAG TPA: LPS export ABC transporter periplasmic protein LptC [Gemmatimonadaceae bacterium]|nr:LPS export ABC transporter periplasmic protein LptC [Gemmatimonadaceae bacterium]